MAPRDTVDHYFAEHERGLRAHGLNPTDDDDWATPDNEIGSPVVFDADSDYHTPVHEGNRMCFACHEVPAMLGDCRCEVCSHAHKRRLARSKAAVG